MPVMLIIGTRPQIIKSPPIIRQMLRHGLDIKVVHTDQHYDYELSKVFFDEMALPDPYVNLEVGSGTHAYQTGGALIRPEKVIGELKPSLMIVLG